MNIKLGKKPRRHDSRTLSLADFKTAGLLDSPLSVDYANVLPDDLGMMLNDSLGCCTISAVGHAVQVWTQNAIGRELTIADSVIRSYYQTWDGYVPGDTSTDQGGVELDVLNKWHQQGFAGNSLDAYAAIHQFTPESIDTPVIDPNLLRASIWLFGGAYLGVELPITAQAQQHIWGVPARASSDDEPGSWGGHAIYATGYNTADETIDFISWGRKMKMTWMWFNKYCSEAYALVSKDWVASNGLAPSGFDLLTLEQKVQQVTA